MRSVLLSIRPEWCEKIANGSKTIEVRKSAPQEVPVKCYIYCTKGQSPNVLLKDKNNRFGFGDYRNACTCDVDGNVDFENVQGKVIGAFLCNKVEEFSVGSLRCDEIEKLACVSYKEMIDYFYKPEELDGKTSKIGYAWHISDLKIYDKPRELSEFYTTLKVCKNTQGKRIIGGCHRVTRAPQSWFYIMWGN